MRVIVDTSVWIDHIKSPVRELVGLLEQETVLAHSWIIGELALGQIRNRHQVIGNLKLLPRAQESPFQYLLDFIDRKKLYSRGLSFTDIQILASALLSNASILTRDKAMLKAAKELGIVLLF
jgi:predicted nucleic acid-binding protein